MTLLEAVGGNLEHLFNNNKFGVNSHIDNFIKHHGDENIQSLTLMKKPFLSGVGVDLVGVISPSFGRKNDYDKLYHPVIVINNKYILDKNHQLNIRAYNGSRGYETLGININKKLSIFDLFDNTKKHYGLQNMITYNVSSNNCQHFLVAVLKSNGLLTSENEKFLKQDTDDAIKGLEPKITPITDTARFLQPVSEFFTNPLDLNPFKMKTF
jgi:hypothetical protein